MSFLKLTITGRLRAVTRPFEHNNSENNNKNKRASNNDKAKQKNKQKRQLSGDID